jgi:hypothetical protein
MPQTISTRRYRSHDYRGHHRGTVREATWEENLQSMQQYMVTLRLQGAAQDRIDWQQKCIANHLTHKPAPPIETLEAPPICAFCDQGAEVGDLVRFSGGGHCHESCAIEDLYLTELAREVAE